MSKYMVRHRKPPSQTWRTFLENHVFRVAASANNTFEFLLSSAWSEGAVYDNREDFSDYIRKTSLEYNNPVESEFISLQEHLIERRP